MLKRFCVEGYRGFGKKTVFDFAKTRDYQYNTDAVKNGIVKDALVYGRNGTGKTNLATAIYDAWYNVSVGSWGYRANSTYLNADKDRKTASFSYLFDFGGVRVLYEYTKDGNAKVRSEHLEVGDEVVFDVNESGKWTTNNLTRFTSGSLVTEGMELYHGLSVLSYVCTNTPQNLLGSIFTLYRFLLSMKFNNSVSLDEDVASVVAQGRVKDLEAFLREHGMMRGSKPHTILSISDNLY